MKKQLFIYCAGGAGKEVFEIARRSNDKRAQWSAIRFVDDVIGQPDGEILRFSDFLALNLPPQNVEFLIANGEPAHRITLMQKLRDHSYTFATLIDETAIVARDAVIGAGCILYPGVHISPGVTVGENCLIYDHSTLAHDTAMASHCVVSMSVSVSGHCEIGEACFLGAHAVIRDRVHVGAWCILGIGCALLQDAQANGIYVGLPARRLRDNEQKRVFP